MKYDISFPKFFHLRISVDQIFSV